MPCLSAIENYLNIGPYTYNHNGNFGKFKGRNIDEYIYENRKLTKIYSLWTYEKIVQRPIYEINYGIRNEIQKIVRKDKSSDFFPNGQQIVVYKSI